MANAAEVISPELVLVDPELAARVRPNWSWALVAPVHSAPAAATAAATAAAAERRASSAVRHLRNVALVLSIAFNVLAVTTLLDDSTSVPTPTKTVQSAPPAPLPAQGPQDEAESRTHREVLATTAERQLLADLAKVPALRRLFTDPATALPLSRVSAQCHPVAAGPSSTLLRCRVSGPRRGAPGRRVQLGVALRCVPAARGEPVRCVAKGEVTKAAGFS